MFKRRALSILDLIQQEGFSSDSTTSRIIITIIIIVDMGTRGKHHHFPSGRPRLHSYLR